MNKPRIMGFDCYTNEAIDREMTDEEYAELLRMYGRTFIDQFERAASLFERAGNSSRAKIAVNRKTDGSYSRQSFFYQEHPTGEVTTIVGSREYMTIRNQIRMG